MDVPAGDKESQTVEEPHITGDTESGKLGGRTKSLLVPDQTDRHDAYDNMNHNQIYHNIINRYGGEWKFGHVEGFFKQSSWEVDDSVFNYVEDDFGVIDSWQRFNARLRKLRNFASKKGDEGGESKGDEDVEEEVFKVIILARHGEGFHNVASARYSGQQWADKWRFLGTDGDIVWGPDPLLTEKGKLQAQENQQFLKQQISKGMPLPSKHYVSPLSRSIETMIIEWEGQEIKPIVVDKLRETIGCNMCHQRLSKREISGRFPSLSFEHEFPEQDVLHEQRADNREQFWEQFVRINMFLQELFEHELGNTAEDEVASVTCHAGTIRAFLTVIGHRNFTIPKGGMIPVVIRGRK